MSSGEHRQRNLSTGSSGGSSSGHHHHRRSTRSTIQPPDGGWGWVIVFASFMINMIADGVSLSIGIIYMELVHHFGESKSKTAWVGSLFLSIPLIAGPIASTLVDRFGCRRIAIIGSVLASFGFLMGYMSKTLEHLFVSFSISGLGLALCFVTTIVSVAFYFEKRRSLATGLSVCGTGIGTFLFAPLTNYLLENYGWRGTLLILSGIFLNMVIFASLMKEVDAPTASDGDSDDDDADSAVIDSDFISEGPMRSSGGQHEFSLDGRKHGGDLLHQESKLSDELRYQPKPQLFNYNQNRLFSSLVHIPTYISYRGSVQVPSDVITELSSKKGGYLHKLLERYPKLLGPLVSNNWPSTIDPSSHYHQAEQRQPFNNNDTRSATYKPNAITTPNEGVPPTIDELASNELKPPQPSVAIIANGNCILPAVQETPNSGLSTDPKSPGAEKPSTSQTKLLRTASRRHKNSLFNPVTSSPIESSLSPGTHYLKNLKLQRGSVTYRNAMLNIKRYKLRASSAPDIFRNSMEEDSIDSEKKYGLWNDIKEVLCDMVDLSIFKQFRYSLFCLSNFLLYACVDVPYVYLPDEAIDSGAADKESSSYLISILGVLNTLGVIIVGYVGDKPWIDSSLLYSAFVALSGISMAVIPWIKSYTGLASIAAIYGFTISANYTLISIILVNLVGLDLLTKHYGPLLLVQGIATLVGPPIAGWLYDMSGNYSTTFYATGVSIFISGAMVVPVAKSCFAFNDESTVVSSSSSSSSSATSRPSSPLSQPLNLHFSPLNRPSTLSDDMEKGQINVNLPSKRPSSTQPPASSPFSSPDRSPAKPPMTPLSPSAFEPSSSSGSTWAQDSVSKI